MCYINRVCPTDLHCRVVTYQKQQTKAFENENKNMEINKEIKREKKKLSDLLITTNFSLKSKGKKTGSFHREYRHTLLDFLFAPTISVD